jgi:hypothetical protein
VFNRSSTVEIVGVFENFFFQKLLSNINQEENRSASQLKSIAK